MFDFSRFISEMSDLLREAMNRHHFGTDISHCNSDNYLMPVGIHHGYLCLLWVVILTLSCSVCSIPYRPLHLVNAVRLNLKPINGLARVCEPDLQRPGTGIVMSCRSTPGVAALNVRNNYSDNPLAKTETGLR